MDNLTRLQKVRIGIAGTGGLGSNVAVCLVRCGFTQLRIIDCDIVEAANLDRQFFFRHQIGHFKVQALQANLLSINADADIEPIVARLDEENVPRLFGDRDVIVECLDRAAEKAKIISALLPLQKFIVSASGIGGIGTSDAVTVHRIKDNLVLVGDLVSDADRYPPVAPKVLVAAAMQADVILEWVIHMY